MATPGAAKKAAVKKGLVSVIIPTHNRAALLRAAVASVFAQRGVFARGHLEIIIIANGCTDNTAAIIAEWQRDFPQTVVAQQFAERLGGAKARNIGLDHARGEYIAFLDDDDRWHEDKLQTQLAILERGQHAIVGTNFVYVYGRAGDRKDERKDERNGVRQDQHRYAAPTAAPTVHLHDLYYENQLGSFSFCVTKRAYIAHSRIDEKLDALQDWDLWLKILLNAGLPAYINPAHHAYQRIDGRRLSNHFTQVIAAQRLFLNAWQHHLDPASIRYHRMRTDCLTLKVRAHGKYGKYCLQGGRVIKAIFQSPYRYHPKKYAHYLALPLLDIDRFRVRFWTRFR